MRKTIKKKYGTGTGVAGIDPIIDPITGLPIKTGGSPITAGGFNTKPIVKYQPGVTDGATGHSGFYLYSRDTTAKNFNIENDREFVRNENLRDVQKTPQWAAYTEKQQKFANGTGTSGVTTKNYLQTPAEALAENDIMSAKAEADAADNPWAMGVQIGGQFLSSMADSGGFAGLLNKEGTPQAALGDNSAEGEIEAEGGEVIETPGGEPAELKGPKHTQGGIDLDVPDGTKIYSDQLKGPDGKTMADRKKARERKMLKLDDLLVSNKGDKAIANSHSRMKMAIEGEELHDLQMQELANQFTKMQEFAMGTGKQGVKMAGGTGPLGYEEDEMNNSLKAFEASQQYVEPKTFMNNFGEGSKFSSPETSLPFSQTSEATPYTADSTQGNTAGSGVGVNFTAGDITGLLGNAVSMFSPMNNTLKNRASDTVNTNQYEGYGDEALATNEEAKNLIASQHDNDQQRVIKSVNGAKRQSRNGARGINTMRATDLAVDLQANDANANLSDQYAKQMMAMLGQESNMKLNIDQVKKGGAAAADLANRQDKDAFYTQLGIDKATMGEGLQQTGKDLNQVAQNKTMMDMVNQMSKYFQFDKNNKIIAINKKTK